MTNFILTMLLYSADCGLIAYDVYTTRLCIDIGCSEKNPLAKPFVDSRKYNELFLTAIGANALIAWGLSFIDINYSNAYLSGVMVAEILCINGNTQILIKYGIKY